MDDDIKGYRPPMREAIKAKCFDCNANFADGRRDCKVRDCPLYIRMPYAKSHRKPTFSWLYGKWSSRYRDRANGRSPEQFVKEELTKNGKIKIGMRALIRAKCYRCCGDYHQGGNEKGRVDCGVLDCPLYYWTPYRGNRPTYNWIIDLDYTKRHRIAMQVMGLQLDEYVARVFGKEESDDDEPNEESDEPDGRPESPPVAALRVRAPRNPT